MLLAIDIGNTSIHSGIFDKKVLKKTFRIPAYSKNLDSLYAGKLKTCVKNIECVIITSVVPEVLKKVEKAVKHVTGKRPIVVGRDVDSGIENLYKNPEQVGSDRLVNARAAYELYGGECVIVDFGTAITIDIVNKKRQYIGGVIAPGPGISLWALSEKTALLPKVTIKRPKAILGRDTKESMLAGIIYGFSGLCDGIVNKLKKKYYRDANVVITGGFSKLIGPYCESADKIDADLTLKGLKLISEDLNV
ncbi:MAG: pantothenate kinase [Candidatus Omnitrophica bacterium CG22_combo_CG10-13_8_21_14_all_43_16]|nr:MAG: pantothenate kinase [Candidatus Omnitrophica bacterium CG22_combo_CG10-13_8_21_14_all_43_16]